MKLKPRPRPELEALIRRSIEHFNSLSKEQQDIIRQKQRESYVRGESMRMDKIGTSVGPSSWWDEKQHPIGEYVRSRDGRQTLICPVCKEGEMTFTGSSWPTGTPGYHHKCDKCGEIQAVRGRIFPRANI